MIQCPICHTDNRQRANFCKRCGTVLAQICPRCSAALPEAALFCDQCGVRLLQPAAGVWNVQAAPERRSAPPDTQPSPRLAEPTPQSAPEQAPPPAAPSTLQQFIPPELMSRLQAAAQHGAMVGERRIVTILFCDTVGSTAAAEQLDPEEWTEIINGAFEHMIRPIYKYEGTVARLMGDGLLAFFGAPIAHEDDPRRAVLAGLEIVQAIAAYARDVEKRWNLGLNVRVGINTGKVVVGSVGSDLRMEYTAIGDAINVAARMEQTAEPGTVQVAANTQRLAEAHFEFQPLGAIAVKGKEAPLPAFRVLGLRHESAQRRGPAGMQAPLLGREAEMERLRQAARRAAQGVGHIAVIVGEAGLGKSRLLEELRRQQEAGGASSAMRWVQAAGAAHEAGQPFALLRALLHGLQSSLQGSQDPADPGELRDGLLALASEARRPGLADVLDVLLGSNGAKAREEVKRGEAPVAGGAEGVRGSNGAGDPGAGTMSGEAFRRRLAEDLGGLLADVTRQGPLVLALDDVQWSDAASVALLLQLLPLADSLPLFFLFSLRPERQAPGWRLPQEIETSHAHRATVINVRPLASEDSAQLVSALLGDRDLPAHVRQLILDKAEGNPFFVEEVIRSLLERGLLESADGALRWRGGAGDAEEIAIPDSLQSLLTARIDRLREETRHTLQLASVIGRSFPYRILQQVSDLGEALPEQLEDLQRRAVIREAARLPEVEYAFHHALMQEAAYRSILLRQRRAYHLRVGEAMEQLFAARLEEFALPLAHHFYEARDARAYVYYRMAGDAAMRVFANVEAAAHYRSAIQCVREGHGVDAGEEELLYLYRRRGRALELNSSYEEALRHYQELMALTQERAAAGRPFAHMELAALVGQARQRVTANPMTNYEEGRALLDRALPLARQLQDRAAEATIMWLQVLLLMFGGDREKQLAFGERGLALARELGLQELQAFLLHDMWYVYGGLGRWQEMNDALRDACKLWQALDNVPMLAASLTRLHFSQAAAGQYDLALQTSEEAYTLAVQGRDLESQALSRAIRGLIHLDRGRPDLALSALHENLALGRTISNVTVLSTGPAYLGLIYATLGDYDQAVNLAREGANYALERFPLIAVMPQAILVRILLMKGDREQAQQIFAQMEDYRSARRRIGFFALSWLMAMVATGELALCQKDHDRALEIAAEFIDGAADGDFRFLLPDAYLLQSRALSAQGHPQQAARALQKGLAEAKTLDSQRTLWPILAELATRAADQGDQAQAEAYRAQAADVVRAMAEHAGSDELRQSFLAQESVRALVDR